MSAVIAETAETVTVETRATPHGPVVWTTTYNPAAGTAERVSARDGRVTLLEWETWTEHDDGTRTGVWNIAGAPSTIPPDHGKGGDTMTLPTPTTFVGEVRNALALAGIADDAIIADVLEARPVLHAGQADNRHFANATMQLYVSRTGIADGEPYERTVTILLADDDGFDTFAIVDGDATPAELTDGDNVRDPYVA